MSYSRRMRDALKTEITDGMRIPLTLRIWTALRWRQSPTGTFATITSHAGIIGLSCAEDSRKTGLKCQMRRLKIILMLASDNHLHSFFINNLSIIRWFLFSQWVNWTFRHYFSNALWFSLNSQKNKRKFTITCEVRWSCIMNIGESTRDASASGHSKRNQNIIHFPTTMITVTGIIVRIMINLFDEDSWNF